MNKSRSRLHYSYLKLLDQFINETPSEEFEIKLKKITANIEKLPSKTKEIFKMSKLSGLTNKEISEFLNISIKTVEFHITKSFKILRNAL
jgi:RNA polymerase sigma-70 factor (ECF subfamily)